MKHNKPVSYLIVIFGLLLMAACNGGEDAVPTSIQPASTPNLAPTGQLPATKDIATPALESTPSVAPALETSEIQSGTVITNDDFLPIDEILSEIDNDVCQNAYETKLELGALIEEGADLAELETAVEELIEELENCPTPTPLP